MMPKPMIKFQCIYILWQCFCYKIIMKILKSYCKAIWWSAGKELKRSFLKYFLFTLSCSKVEGNSKDLLKSIILIFCKLLWKMKEKCCQNLSCYLNNNNKNDHEPFFTPRVFVIIMVVKLFSIIHTHLL